MACTPLGVTGQRLMACLPLAGQPRGMTSVNAEYTKSVGCPPLLVTGHWLIACTRLGVTGHWVNACVTLRMTGHWLIACTRLGVTGYWVNACVTLWMTGHWLIACTPLGVRGRWEQWLSCTGIRSTVLDIFRKRLCGFASLGSQRDKLVLHWE